MVGARCACPILGPKHRAPTIETIALLTFYKIIKAGKQKMEKGFGPSLPADMPAPHPDCETMFNQQKKRGKTTRVANNG
jgi:hypothetical protein